MNRHRLVAILAATVALALPALGAAQSPEFKLTLDYDGTVLVKVLDIRIEQAVGEDGFVSSARMKSYGVLSLFKRLDVKAQATGPMRSDRPAPAQFRHTNLDGVFNRTVEVIWRADEVSTKAAPAYPTLGDPAPTKSQKLAASDPLTELMRIALPTPGTAPCSRTARLFDGRQLYAVEFSAPVARQGSARERTLGLTDGVRCSLTFTEVAGFDAKPAHKRNQGLKGPFSLDFARAGHGGPWVIAGAQGRTPLGEARVEIRALRLEVGGGSRFLALN